MIAIDGPSGAGKGVVSQHLAQGYDFHLLDSGALYRLLGLAARRAGLLPDQGRTDEKALAVLAGTLDIGFEPTCEPENPLVTRLSGEDVTLAIRTDEAGRDASAVALLPKVRRALYGLQRSFRRSPGLVADGRDMGSVIFPEAEVKIFLTATVQARAERRYNQLKHKGIGVSLPALFQSIQDRDERDRTRAVAPLEPAEDAMMVDSTNLGVEEVLARVDALVREKLG